MPSARPGHLRCRSLFPLQIMITLSTTAVSTLSQSGGKYGRYSLWMRVIGLPPMAAPELRHPRRWTTPKPQDEPSRLDQTSSCSLGRTWQAIRVIKWRNFNWRKLAFATVAGCSPRGRQSSRKINAKTPQQEELPTFPFFVLLTLESLRLRSPEDQGQLGDNNKNRTDDNLVPKHNVDVRRQYE